MNGIGEAGHFLKISKKNFGGLSEKNYLCSPFVETVSAGGRIYQKI